MYPVEYSASEIRSILQSLFPHRRLVLSQFTFFAQVGVARPTGESFRRGRRCFRLEDILSIASVIGLKEEGIPLKNIDVVPGLIQHYSSKIFDVGPGCRLNGFKEVISLCIPGELTNNAALQAYLDSAESPQLFWSYDVGALASQLRQVAFIGDAARKAA